MNNKNLSIVPVVELPICCSRSDLLGETTNANVQIEEPSAGEQTQDIYQIVKFTCSRIDEKFNCTIEEKKCPLHGLQIFYKEKYRIICNVSNSFWGTKLLKTGVAV